MVPMNKIRGAVVATANLLAPSGTVVAWDKNTYPHRGLGDAIVLARVISGPAITRTSTYSSNEATSIDWIVDDDVAVGDLVGIEVSGVRWGYEVQAGDTNEDIRDGLQAVILASVLPGVTITPGTWMGYYGAFFGAFLGSSASLNFDASGVPGLLWRPAAIGPSAILVNSSVASEVASQVVDVTVELQAYAAGRGPEALELLSYITGGLQLSSAVLTRNAWGVTRRGTPGIPTDISALAGPDWESRAVARLDLGVVSYQATALAGAISTARVVTDDFTAEAVAP